MSAAAKTTDHREIRTWVEQRGGRPAKIKATADHGGPGILRIDFREPDASLELTSWEEFFDRFETHKLAFLHQDETSSGKTSRFVKLVARD
jgi:hypothetical protein